MRSELFGVCPCGGRYDTRSVDVPMRDVELENVPQGACPSCGGASDEAETMLRLESLAFSRGPDPIAARWTH